MKLSELELLRYHRQIILPEIAIEGQKKLKNARVLVVGAGGLGCTVLLYLTTAGVGTIGIVDNDVVEISNLPRQVLYNESDVGKNKTDCALAHLNKKNPLVSFKTYNFRLTVDNTFELFTEYDLVIDCTDNFSTRYLINDACVLLNLPFIYGGILKFAGQVAVFNFTTNDYNGPTYRCAFPQPPHKGTIADCNDAGVLGVLPGIVGIIQATEAIKIITGVKNVLAGKILMINSMTMIFDKLEIKRNKSVWYNFPVNEDAFLKMKYDVLCGDTRPDIQFINRVELEELVAEDKNLLTIDLRPLSEKAISFFNNVKRIPVSELHKHVSELDVNRKIIFFCSKGITSLKAIQFLSELIPVSNFYSLEDGIDSWNTVPVETI